MDFDELTFMNLVDELFRYVHERSCVVHEHPSSDELYFAGVAALGVSFVIRQKCGE